MLIENKFIFVPIPRCASTSFFLSCLKYGLNIQQLDNSTPNLFYNEVKDILNDEQIVHTILYSHSVIDPLIIKYGNKDIISVNRNRYDRFISLWYHIISELDRSPDNYEVVNSLKKMNSDDLLSYTKYDISSYEKVIYLTNSFLKKYNLEFPKEFNALYELFLPASYHHQFSKNIIWFDFDKLYELEEWVSNKLNMEFKLENINSSKHIDCNLKLDDHFIEKYNEIYDSYDFPKTKKTLL